MGRLVLYAALSRPNFDVHGIEIGENLHSAGVDALGRGCGGGDGDNGSGLGEGRNHPFVEIISNEGKGGGRGGVVIVEVVVDGFAPPRSRFRIRPRTGEGRRSVRLQHRIRGGRVAGRDDRR